MIFDPVPATRRAHGRLSKSGLLVLVLTLSACGLSEHQRPLNPEPARHFSLGLRAGQADLAYAPRAIDRAVGQFMAPSAGARAEATSRPSSSSQGGGGVVAAPPRDSARIDADLDFSAISAREQAMALSHHQALPGGWAVDTTLRLGRSTAGYTIPRGQLRVPLPETVPIFGGRPVVIDTPVTLNSRTRFAEAEALGLSPPLPALPGQLRLGAGAGLRATQSRFRVASDLIAIDSRDQVVQPYMLVQARYQHPQERLRLPLQGFVEGRAYGRRRAGLRAGIDLIWP